MPLVLPQAHQLPEVEVLRIKVAHLELQLAQLQAQMQLTTLTTAREALMKQAMLAYIPEAELDDYVIDLDSGLLRPREQPES